MPDAIIPFTPDENSAPPFKAQITVAEGQLNISTWWNVAGQRWYLKVTEPRGKDKLFRPLIGSPQNYDTNLISSISTSKLVYREDNGTLEVTV